MPDGNLHIAVVGAGIVGVSTACMLAEKGFVVMLLDPHEPGKGGASRANAAQVFPALIHPLPSPAVLLKSIRLLADPKGPVFIPPAHMVSLVPWLTRFALACTPAHFRRGVAALTELNRHAYSCFEALLKRAGKRHMLVKTGAIQLYESEARLKQGLRLWQEVPTSHSGGAELLDAHAVHDLVPCLTRSVTGGVLLSNTGVLTDPLEVVRVLGGYARELGVSIVKDQVVQVLPDGNTVDLECAGRGARSFDRVVIAAGVWTEELARGLSEPLGVDTERGYNLTVHTCKPAISHALVFAERGVVATQLSSGLRLGGWDELGGVGRGPTPKLFERMEALARELMPGFDWGRGERWMGLRPSLPHGLPVIGRSKRHAGVYYACGHGHLGVTQGPVTGLAIANLIAGEEAPFDLAPFALRRDARRHLITQGEPDRNPVRCLSSDTQ